VAVVISGLFCIIVGIALGVGGAKVISLGGTWYFAIVAAGFLLTGALLLMRRRTALWVYALLMLGALGWAVYEVGLDWWQLAPPAAASSRRSGCGCCAVDRTASRLQHFGFVPGVVRRCR